MTTSITSSMSAYWTSLQQTLYVSAAATDGVVSADTLGTVLSSDNNAQELVNEADADGSSTISLSEFATFASRFATDTGMALLSTQDVSSAVASVFSALDTNGDGQLSVSELQQAASILSTTTSSEVDTTASVSALTDNTTAATTTSSYEARIASILSTVDYDGDGTFTKSDVEAMILQAFYGIGSDNSGTIDSLSMLEAAYGVNATVTATTSATTVTSSSTTTSLSSVTSTSS